MGVGSLIAVEDKLILLNEKGELRIIKATPQSVQLFTVSSLPRDTFWTPPSFSNVVLFIRSLRKVLYCFDLRN